MLLRVVLSSILLLSAMVTAFSASAFYGYEHDHQLNAAPLPLLAGQPFTITASLYRDNNCVFLSPARLSSIEGSIITLTSYRNDAVMPGCLQPVTTTELINFEVAVPNLPAGDYSVVWQSRDGLVPSIPPSEVLSKDISIIDGSGTTVSAQAVPMLSPWSMLLLVFMCAVFAFRRLAAS